MHETLVGSRGLRVQGHTHICSQHLFGSFLWSGEQGYEAGEGDPRVTLLCAALPWERLLLTDSNYPLVGTPRTSQHLPEDSLGCRY